jgi:hypothetical protein
MNEQEFLELQCQKFQEFINPDDHSTEEWNIYNRECFNELIQVELEHPNWTYVRWLLAKMYLNYHNYFEIDDRNFGRMKRLELHQKNWDVYKYKPSGFELMNCHFRGYGVPRNIAVARQLLYDLLNEYHSWYAFNELKDAVPEKIKEKINRCLDIEHEPITFDEIDEIFRYWDN